MSRAFVKEDASQDAKVVLPDKPISAHANYVTPRGLDLLRQAQRAADEELLSIAADTSGDGKQRKAQLARELRYLKARLKSAILVASEGQAPTTVRFGATVTVVDENDAERRLVIVGEDEANVAEGRISYVSPLARALHGAQVGDIVTWRRPAGELELEVLRVEYVE